MTGARVTVGEALARATERLARAGIESAPSEAFSLLGHLLDSSRGDLLLARAQPLGTEQLLRLEGWLSRREQREPLQHILGVAHFYGLELRVTPQVLIPRPETERLVEVALERLHRVLRPVVLDVGTGSGAVALALKAERPDAVVIATDVSEAALKVACENAERLGLKVDFALSDLLTAPEVDAVARRAHLIVSNPPYLPEGDRERVSPEVRADPEGALYAGADGLDLFRRLERQAHGLLKPGAALLLELDPRNVADALETAGEWKAKEIHADLLGRARFLCLER